MSIFFSKDAGFEIGALVDDEHRHCSKVLRYKVGDEIFVINGKGISSLVSIVAIEKERTTFKTLEYNLVPKRLFNLAIAISPTKSADRNEWFLEKATEMGISEVYFMQVSRGERPRIKKERLDKIALSAIKQSKQFWLPEISEMLPFDEMINLGSNYHTRLIAHCNGTENFITNCLVPGKSTLLFIGPEGDFSKEEIELAENAGFISVSLGETRLRTETAGIVGGAMLVYGQKF